MDEKDKEQIGEVILKEKERSLFMSRISKNIKEEFTDFAEENFCNDFGMAFTFVWEQFKIGKVFTENTNYKLDDILAILKGIPIEKKEQDKGIHLLSGRVMKGGNEKHE